MFVVAPTVLYYSVLGGECYKYAPAVFSWSIYKKYNYCDKFRNKLLVKIFLFYNAGKYCTEFINKYACWGKAHIPFARDCSAFVMIEATTLLMLFETRVPFGIC